MPGPDWTSITGATPRLRCAMPDCAKPKTITIRLQAIDGKGAGTRRTHASKQVSYCEQHAFDVMNQIVDAWPV